MRIAVYLTGGRKGQNLQFGKFVFRKGVCHIDSDNTGDLEYLRRCLEVETEFERITCAGDSSENDPKRGPDSSVRAESPPYPAITETGSADDPDRLGGIGGKVPDAGNGPPKGMMTGEAIRAAVLALDPSDSQSWTVSGFPALSALQQLFPTITRADIQAAAGGITRSNVLQSRTS
jgi:hypothetical protein